VTTHGALPVPSIYLDNMNLSLQVMKTKLGASLQGNDRRRSWEIYIPVLIVVLGGALIFLASGKKGPVEYGRAALLSLSDESYLHSVMA